MFICTPINFCWKLIKNESKSHGLRDIPPVSALFCEFKPRNTHFYVLKNRTERNFLRQAFPIQSRRLRDFERRSNGIAVIRRIGPPTRMQFVATWSRPVLIRQLSARSGSDRKTRRDPVRRMTIMRGRNSEEKERKIHFPREKIIVIWGTRLRYGGKVFGRLAITSGFRRVFLLWQWIRFNYVCRIFLLDWCVSLFGNPIVLNYFIEFVMDVWVRFIIEEGYYFQCWNINQ